MTDYDAIVVGGGIVGASTAYHFARSGERVALFDRADEGRATDAGAGIVAPISSGHADDDAWFRFAREAARHYPDLADDLADAGLDETGYTRRRMLRVALDPSDVPAFDAAAERIQARAGAVNTTVESISSDRAQDLVPALADAERILSVPEAARVDGRLVTRALRTAGSEHGVAVFEEEVDTVCVRDGQVTGVETERGSYGAPNVVIAGGAWSRRFGDQLGITLPITPERGQIVHLRTDTFDDRTDEWPIVNAFGDLYAVSWPDGRIAVGATREKASGFDARSTVEGVEAILSGAMDLLPGVSDAEILEIRVGLRPVSSDGRPIIGGVPGVDGGFVATGHGSTGLHLGPYTGLLVSKLVSGRESPIDIESFSPKRFTDS